MPPNHTRIILTIIAYIACKRTGRARQVMYDTSGNVAEMTIQLVCESYSIKVFDSSASTEDENLPKPTKTRSEKYAQEKTGAPASSTCMLADQVPRSF